MICLLYHSMFSCILYCNCCLIMSSQWVWNCLNLLQKCRIYGKILSRKILLWLGCIHAWSNFLEGFAGSNLPNSLFQPLLIFDFDPWRFTYNSPIQYMQFFSDGNINYALDGRSECIEFQIALCRYISPANDLIFYILFLSKYWAVSWIAWWYLYYLLS